MNDPIIWFVSTDGAGYKTCVPYDISPHKVEPDTDIKELFSKLNARLDNIEERIGVKDESNNATIEQSNQRTEWNI
jgi:hypothetical protein